DTQFSSELHWMVRANTGAENRPIDNPPASAPPQNSGAFYRKSDEIYSSLSKVLSNRTLNEIKVGYASFYYFNQSIVQWPNNPQAFQGLQYGTPQILLRSLTIGQTNANFPQRLGQNYYSFRDDVTHSFSKAGHHDVKAGGEFLFLKAFT